MTAKWLSIEKSGIRILDKLYQQIEHILFCVKILYFVANLYLVISIRFFILLLKNSLPYIQCFMFSERSLYFMLPYLLHVRHFCT